MSALGIIVEGPRDAAVYRVMIRRIRSDVERVVPWPCGGVPALLKKFVGVLRGFEYYRIDKALVIRDSGGKDPQTSEAGLNDRLIIRVLCPTSPSTFTRPDAWSRHGCLPTSRP